MCILASEGCLDRVVSSLYSGLLMQQQHTHKQPFVQDRQHSHCKSSPLFVTTPNHSFFIRALIKVAKRTRQDDFYDYDIESERRHHDQSSVQVSNNKQQGVQHFSTGFLRSSRHDNGSNTKHALFSPLSSFVPTEMMSIELEPIHFDCR